MRPLPGSFRALALCLALAACGGEPAPSPGEVSTWEIIRDDILAANCAGCHAAGTSFARQSGLVLTPDVAWEQLFNRVPNNEAAAGDNLLLVSDQGLAGLYRSFLWLGHHPGGDEVVEELGVAVFGGGVVVGEDHGADQEEHQPPGRQVTAISSML